MKQKRRLFLALLFFACLYIHAKNTPIDRKALVTRNNVTITSVDSLSSLSVGNGEFAFTADITGLQTFPETYNQGIPLGTQSQWGWHSFANPNNYRFEETLKPYDFRGRTELYSTQFNEKGRQQEAAEWFRVNQHRIHLGTVGLEMTTSNGQNVRPEHLKNIHQQLNLWNGIINSNFSIEDKNVSVKTVCDPQKDMIASEVNSSMISSGQLNISFKFPYPTGKHVDDACDWNSPEKHSTQIIERGAQFVVLKREIDSTIYYVTIQWSGQADFKEKAPHYFTLSPKSSLFSFVCAYTQKQIQPDNLTFTQTAGRSASYWNSFWTKGGAIDFSQCKDARAKELERRVVLSQYLMAIQCAGSIPPQETGLTYNSWFGKFHLEMHWWHAVHFALWNRTDLLERSLDWYAKAFPIAKKIAQRQGFAGARWMKMTDPSGQETPSKVGSFLIWQQPHFIYMAEMVYRSHPSQEVINKYKDLVFATAEFMASFANYDMLEGRYILKGAIPAQETLRASETVNPPFELSYWHFAMSVAQEWRKRAGLSKKLQWEELIDKLSPLAAQDGLYLAAETATDTYKDIRFTSDHMAVLGALGILPKCKLVRTDYMKNTFNWIWDNWNWGKTWGWDFAMTAMSAARLGMPDKAVGALLMDKRTNTYLPNGHNYQDQRLRIYLPGNGGLLSAVAMMCAGWDGCKEKNPGFPKDGKWNVKWEGLAPMP